MFHGLDLGVQEAGMETALNTVFGAFRAVFEGADKRIRTADLFITRIVKRGPNRAKSA